MAKKIKKTKNTTEKRTVQVSYSSDLMKPVWLFDKIDKSGPYAFDVNRIDFDSRLFLDKMISYTNMTWQEVKQQTHDRSNKSKNHSISIDALSKEAQDRIRALHYDEYSDDIFSFALLNLIRVFGIKEDEYFHVVWFDSKHEVCPVKK